jgi:hypothetical protein
MAAAVARAVAKNVAGKAGTAFRALGQEATGVLRDAGQKAATSLTKKAVIDSAKAGLKDYTMKNAPGILGTKREETASGYYRPPIESYFGNTAAAPNTVYVQAPCNCPKCEKTVGDANSSLAEHFNADKYYKPLIGEDVPLSENPPAEMMPEVDGGRRRRQKAKTIRRKSRSRRRSRRSRRSRSRRTMN